MFCASAAVSFRAKQTHTSHCPNVTSLEASGPGVSGGYFVWNTFHLSSMSQSQRACSMPMPIPEQSPGGLWGTVLQKAPLAGNSPVGRTRVGAEENMADRCQALGATWRCNTGRTASRTPTYQLAFDQLFYCTDKVCSSRYFGGSLPGC